MSVKEKYETEKELKPKNQPHRDGIETYEEELEEMLSKLEIGTKTKPQHTAEILKEILNEPEETMNPYPKGRERKKKIKSKTTVAHTTKMCIERKQTIAR